jgi:hypothetical protein
MGKGSKTKEVGRTQYIVAQSFEEQQRFLKEGTFLTLPTETIPRKKQKKGKKKKWLSGRCRHDRYSGVFQI